MEIGHRDRDAPCLNQKIIVRTSLQPTIQVLELSAHRPFCPQVVSKAPKAPFNNFSACGKNTLVCK
jgi:hypothetical protein